MKHSNINKTYQLYKFLALPIGYLGIILICFLFFYDSIHNYIPTFIAASLINIFLFSLVYFYLSKFILKYHAAYTFFPYIIISSVLHFILFETNVLHYPAVVMTDNFPVTIVFAEFVIISISVFYCSLSFFLILNTHVLSIQSYQLLMKGNQIEVDSLRLQMSPHFISNALNNLHALIRVQDKKRAFTYNVEIIELIGEQIKYMHSERITIQEELSWLEYYLQVEKLRVTNKFDYNIIVSDEQLYAQNIPPMLIQPLVENCISHGFNPAVFTKKGIIEISVSKINNNTISIAVQDNGVGSNAIPLADKMRKSISTSNIEKRVQLISEIGKFHISIRKTSDINGTKNELIIKENL